MNKKSLNENVEFVQSPFFQNGKSRLRKQFSTKDINREYLEYLNIDVSKYFEGIEKIYLYECLKTGYQFFYPSGIEGDSEFYEQLEKFSWYYIPWKWEHNYVFKLLSGSEKILEVGSGGLGFLKRLQNNGYDITGLELNKHSIIKAKNNGLNVLDETIQKHAILNKNKYDLVCSFQVLEHISDVYSFLKSSIDCLKPGGKLVVCVPNNDSFIKLNEGGMLNKPPHHMGWWNKKSLEHLVKVFNLKLDKIDYEPLQTYHIEYFVNVSFDQRISNQKFKGLLIRFKIRSLYKLFVTKFRSFIHGHTMSVVYIKK